MENVTFFTLLPQTILGRTKEGHKEFLYYSTVAFAFAEAHNLNILNGCGVSTFENFKMQEKYFSKLKRKSTVLIIDKEMVGNFEILDAFIEKQVIFRVIEGDFLITPYEVKKMWTTFAENAHDLPNVSVEYLKRTGMLELDWRGAN